MYARDVASLATPIGLVRVTGTADRIEAIAILPDGDPIGSNFPALAEALAQLDAHFAGRLTQFDLPLAPSLTPRGQALREAIIAVGYGRTASYGDLARAAASSPRAVGQACARNPYPIVVPCHRVLNAAGSLGAYSAGEGPVTKRWLLAFEQRGGGRGLLL